VTDDIPGRLLASGRSADVYDAGDGRVLRRYRDGRPPARVAREAEVMTHARAHGVPVPEVFDVTGSDIVMERAVGPTMFEALAGQRSSIAEQAGLLARLHAIVHSVPPLGWLPAPFGDGAADRRTRGRTGKPDGAADGDAGDGDMAGHDHVLLHRDLHPLNVILTANGPLIIDWEGAASGPAPADVAMTWLIVVFSDIDAPESVAAELRQVQDEFGREFLRAAGPVDRRWLEASVRHRLADRHLLPTEKDRLERVLHSGKYPGQ
jgi:aminoglycoside phosphotransferase (APT) family kinase protein